MSWGPSITGRCLVPKKSQRKATASQKSGEGFQVQSFRARNSFACHTHSPYNGVVSQQTCIGLFESEHVGSRWRIRRMTMVVSSRKTRDLSSW